MNKRFAFTAVVPAAFALALTGCSSSSSSESTSSSAAASSAAASSASASGAPATGSASASADDMSILSGKDIGYASPVAAQQGQQVMNLGLEAAAKEVGATVTVYDSNISADTQVSNIQTMIQKGMSVIGTWTLDPGATAGIYTQAQDAGIPVIGVNSEGTGVTASIWYETQLCEPGGPAEQTAAMYAKKYPGGSVITIGLDGVPSIDNAVKCFTDAATAAGLTVTAHVSNNTDDAAGGQKLIADMLTKYPDVNGIWAYNDASALGASAAVMSAGKTISDGESDGVIVTGANGDDDAIKAVKEGRLTGTWDPNNVEFGWLMVKVAGEALAGDAPASTILKSTFIDKSTIDAYVEPSARTVSFDTLDITTG